jgi:hypothetical protein
MTTAELEDYYPQKQLYTYGSPNISYLGLNEIAEDLGDNYHSTITTIDPPSQILLLRKSRNGIDVSTHYRGSAGTPEYGCTHLYTDFLPNKTFGVGGSMGYYAAYIYDPMIPKAEGITTEVTDAIVFSDDYYVVCDWREIIYQMAKDYYAHHLEDDFHLRVRRNNYIKYKNLNLYPTGHTGYE